LYWKLISKVRKPVGRGQTSKEVQELIFRVVVENPMWGAPRIHGELLMLGFDVSERTISRWMKRAARDPEPAKRWLTFLRNHREAVAAMGFFTVPTITFSSLYCFFVISHDRRRILHFNITRHPTSSWIVQQLREAFPFGSAPRFVIFDRDAKYGLEVPAAVRSLRVNPLRTSFESPWQNGVAERWVGSCRRDLLDHIIAVDERHLKRRLSEYIHYYHEDRTHLGLREGNARRQPSHYSLRSRPFSCATGRVTPPVRSGCLIRTNVGSRKRPGSLILYIYRYSAQGSRDRFLALEGEGITWMGQPSRQGIAPFVVRIEFWRSRGLARRPRIPEFEVNF